MKVEVIKGKFYYVLDRHILIAPHALIKAKERGVDGFFLSKMEEEKENLKDVVANSLGQGKVRGVFYLTFPDTRGKVVWEIMSKNGERLESVEEVVEHNDCMIVVYTYLSYEQKFSPETKTSKARRQRERKLRSL